MARAGFLGPLTCMVTLCPALRRAPCLVSCSAVAILTKAPAFSFCTEPFISRSPGCSWHQQSGDGLCLKAFVPLLVTTATDTHMASPVYITCQVSAGLCTGCLYVTALIFQIHLCSTKEGLEKSCPSATELWETLVSGAKDHIQFDFDMLILSIFSETHNKNLK